MDHGIATASMLAILTALIVFGTFWMWRRQYSAGGPRTKAGLRAAIAAVVVLAASQASYSGAGFAVGFILNVGLWSLVVIAVGTLGAKLHRRGGRR